MLRLKARSRSALGSRFITISCINQIQVLDRIDAFRKVRRELPANATLGLVPTMGVYELFHQDRVYSNAFLLSIPITRACITVTRP